MFARISAEITKPFPERPFDGIFNITAELSPMASPIYESGRANDTDPLLSRLLEKSLRRSGALDVESLCLRAGRSVWAVRADLHILSADGALIDACCAAAIAALQHFRLPATSVASGAEGEGVIVYPPDRRAPVTLGIRHMPYAITTAFVRAGGDKPVTGSGGNADSSGNLVALADPNKLELACSEGEVIVTANKDGEVCQIAKLGGVPADAIAVLEVVERAVAQAKEMARTIDEVLKQDAARKKGDDVEASAENER